MLIECNNCGAPLDVSSGARQVRCGYCRMTSPVRRMRTLSVQAPADWQPPKVWMPPPQAPQPSVALHYTATTTQGASGAGPLIVVALLGVIVIGVAVGAFLFSAQSGSGSVSGNRSPEVSKKKAEPTVVSANRAAEPEVASARAAASAARAQPASTPVSKSWPKPKSTPTPKATTPPPPPPTTPKPQSTGKCGCAPGDLMCAMKCAQK